MPETVRSGSVGVICGVGFGMVADWEVRPRWLLVFVVSGDGRDRVAVKAEVGRSINSADQWMNMGKIEEHSRRRYSYSFSRARDGASFCSCSKVRLVAVNFDMIPSPSKSPTAVAVTTHRVLCSVVSVYQSSR